MNKFSFVTALIVIGLILYLVNIDQPIAQTGKPDLLPHKQGRLTLNEFLSRIEAKAVPISHHVQVRQNSVPLEKFLTQLKL